MVSNYLSALFTVSVIALSACQSPATSENTEPKEIEAQDISQKTRLFDYGLQNVLSCVGEESGLIAAHRGMSRAWDIPENSLEGLRRLITDGTLIAELDVAGLKTGEQILYHDGTWERKSTGTGPVASSTFEDREKILLKSFAGTLSAERPPLLSEVLDLSKDKIFLEIDFKSSAETDRVLQLIRNRDMADQVVLIAYTQERALELHALAPEMIISAPGDAKGVGLNPEKTLLWMGRNVDEVTEPTNTLGYIGLVARDDNVAAKAAKAVFLVSDWSTDLPNIVGQDTEETLLACLAEKG